MLRRAASIAFLDGNWHFTRLTSAIANAAFAIADHGQRREAHDATTLDGLGHAVHLHQLFLKIALSTLIALLLVIVSSPYLKLQPAFTRSVCECLDPSVISKS